MSPDVLLQVGQLGELPLTDLAAVWLDAEVNPHVLRQVGAVCEGFSALAALVGLVSLVAAGVGLEVGLGARVGLELVVVLLGVRQVGEVHGGAMKAWWTGAASGQRPPDAGPLLDGCAAFPHLQPLSVGHPVSDLQGQEGGGREGEVLGEVGGGQ